MPHDEPSPGLRAALMRGAPPVPGDRLVELRKAARRAENLQRELVDLEERELDRKAELRRLMMEELPDLLDAAGVTSISVDAEGNQPAFSAELKPYYKASIAAEWDEARRDRAFRWLEDNGFGDLVKREFTVALDRDEEAAGRKLAKLLSENGFAYSVRRNVPWNTLTAFVRERIEKHSETLPLDTLGATVGRIVNLKPLK